MQQKFFRNLKKQTILFRRLYTFIIQLFIILDQEFVTIPESLQLSVLFFGNIQSSSYLIQTSKQKFQNVEYSSYQTLYFILFTLEPYFQFYNSEHNTFQHNFYWIIITFFLLTTTIIIILFTKFNKLYFQPSNLSNSLIEIMKKTDRITYTFLKVMSIIFQLLNICLIIPISVTLIGSIYLHWYVQAEQVSVILMLIFYVIIIIINILRLNFSQENITFKLNGFSDLYRTKSGIILFYLKISQPLFQLYLNYQKILIQSILLTLIILIQLYDVLSNFSSGNKKHVGIILLAQSLNITSLFVLLFQNMIRQEFNNILMIVLLFPLTSYVIIQIWRNLHLQIQINYQTIGQLHYRLAILINKRNHFKESSFEKLTLALSFRNHRLQCSKVECFCQVDPSTFYNFRKEQYFINNFEEYQIQQLLGEFLKLILKEKITNVNFIYYLHYIAGLSHIGQINQSYLELKQLIRKCNQNEMFNNLSILQNEKAKYLLQKIIIQFYSKLSIEQQNNQQNIIEQAVSLFINTELINFKICNKIIKALSVKESYYRFLLQKKNLSSSKLFKISMRSSEQIIKYESQISINYYYFQTKKLQSSLTFYLTNISSNFIDAATVQNIALKIDGKVHSFFQEKFNFSIFSNQVSYLQLNYEDKLLQIIKFSSDIDSFFGYNIEQFNNEKNIDFLVPLIVKQNHNEFVQHFMQSGESSFYQKVRETFYQDANGFLVPFDFFFDITLTISDDFCFYGFCMQQLSSQIHIFADEDGNIRGITRKFFEQLGYNFQDFMSLDLFTTIYTLKIQIIFPEFQFKEVNLKLLDTKLYFLKKKYFLVYQFQKLQLQENFWKNSKILQIYNVKIYVQKHKRINKVFYQLTIDEINQYVKKEDRLNQIDKQKTYIAYVSNNFIHTLQSQTHDTQRNLQSGADVQKSDELSEQIQIQSQNDFSNIYSPMNKTRNRLLEHSNCHNQLISIQRIQTKQLTNNLNETKKNKFFFQQSSSYVEQNSQSQINRSHYTKKYELVKQIEISNQSLVYIKIFKLLISLLFIICFLFTLNTLIVKRQQFSRFIQEIDMISIEYDFFGPQNIVYALRFANSDNKELLILNKTSKEEYEISFAFSYGLIKEEFLNLKTVFFESLQNEFLKDFFYEKYVIINFMKYSSNEIYQVNMSLRSAIFNYVQYSYEATIAYLNNRSTTNTAFRTFNFANYFQFQDTFRSLSNEIFQYTKAKAIMIKLSQYYQLIALLSIVIFLTFLINLTYHKYIKFTEKILNCVKFIDKSTLISEIEKINIILKQVKLNHNHILNFKFNLKEEEKQFYIQNLTRKTDRINFQHDNQIGQKIIKLFQLFLLYFPFLLLSLINTSGLINYLDKYEKTSEFYKELLNMGFKITGLQDYSHYPSYMTQFTFVSQQDLQAPIVELEQAYSEIINFTQLLTNFQPDQYLFTQEFIQNVTNIIDQDLCKFLDQVNISNNYQQDLRKKAEQFCESSYNGVLKRGMIETLNTMVIKMQNDQQIDQFQSRKFIPTKQIEAAYIVTKVIQQLIVSCQNQFHQITQNLLTNFIILSIIQIVYCLATIVFINTIISKQLLQEQQKLKRILMIPPMRILFSNDQYERYIRYLTKSVQFI